MRGHAPCVSDSRGAGGRVDVHEVGAVVTGGRLAAVDLDARLPKKKAERRLESAQQRLLHLRLVAGGLLEDGAGETRLGPPLVCVFEGWDASGKGGCIKRLVAPLDPRHVRVRQFAAPTKDEKRHHFLWRFWPALPGHGGMTVLDRSWYGRVLVERVEGFATREEWGRAYREIEEFERTLVDEGTVLCKFWLHVSEAAQLERFEARREDPLKRWKLTEEDWRNRDRRADYEAAVEDMVAGTDRSGARWHLVAGDDKRTARAVVVEETVAALEAALEADGRQLPETPAL